MQQRRDDEFERESAEVERFALLDDAHVEIGAVGDVFEIVRRDRGADDLRVRARTEQSGERARVVGLGVVDDDVVNACGVGDLGDVRLVFVKEFRMARLDESGL